MNFFPVKIFLCTALLSSGVVAETPAETPATTASPVVESSGKHEIYMGIDGFISDNTFTSTTGRVSVDHDNDSKGVKIKVGARFAETWRIQAYFKSESYDDPVYGGKNNNLNELGADVIKAFPITESFAPFVQAGVGFGRLKLDGLSDSSAKEIGGKVGAGIFYNFTKSFEGIVGIDLQGRSWSDIQILRSTVERSEGSLKYYIGMNYFF